ncbi:MAG TPA: PLP-dependent aminotransferase family protein [Gaiellaceae bacterium]|nr:PLP-dependent aminotransferase family protein [Gaiellaceae bacterium]
MDVVSFARGVPAPECLPIEELADCARAAISRDGATVLSYGPGGGYAPLREWIAARHGVEPSRVVVTSGSLQGFVFLAEQLVRPGTRVLVEAPTYDRPLKILARLGADVIGLASDEGGLLPDALEEALAAGPKPAFLYTIATFQNPSGRTLSLERRRRIVDIARAHELLVVEDDPYGLVRFEGEPLPTMFELEGGVHVAYASSFSKTVAPGVRVGYFVLSPELAAQIEALAVSTYITPPFLAQATVHEFLSRGSFEPNLVRVNGLLRARRDAMLEALDRHLVGEATWSRPEGGYFVWLDLAAGPETADVLPLAERAGVPFVKGSDFFVGGDGGRHSARLAYSFVSPDEIADGMARLAPLLLGTAREPALAPGRASG